ncbi:MAG: 30S ribosomal protein S20 [Proteobacteria bacterium]|nr:30S ribosomal protein S20 [Pseudomonadota bacterium]
MANSKQAIKRAKQNAETYKLRHAQRSMVRTAVKAVRASIEANLDSSASKKVIHKNAAARTKSRLSKAVKALS